VSFFAAFLSHPFTVLVAPIVDANGGTGVSGRNSSQELNRERCILPLVAGVANGLPLEARGLRRQALLPGGVARWPVHSRISLHGKPKPCFHPKN
jgi:hypothetical protein